MGLTVAILDDKMDDYTTVCTLQLITSAASRGSL